MNVTDEDIRKAVQAKGVKGDIVIPEPDGKGGGTWFVLPGGGVHGIWYPDGGASVLVCEGTLAPCYSTQEYYCEVCEEYYPR